MIGARAGGMAAQSRRGRSSVERAMAVDVAMQIRDKIRAGVLPLPPDPPEKCFVGKGTNRPCDGCDALTASDELEYELDLSDGRTLLFHEKCLSAWHLARAERMA
jgi:hypothetical protein